MTTPAYPGTVPYSPDRSSWQYTPYLPPIQTEMDGGNKRQRGRPGDNVGTLAQVVWMTKDEWTTLKAFLDTDLNLARARFTMQVWTGAAYESKLVQFDEVPTIGSISSDTVGVTMKLRVFP